MERKKAFKWLFKVSFYSKKIKCTGKEPILLWKEIEKILRETAQDFPGYNLTYFYLCPSCLIEQCGSKELESLPVDLLKDKVAAHDLEEKEKERKDFICKKGHRTSAQMIKGQSEENSTIIDFTKQIQGFFKKQNILIFLDTLLQLDNYSTVTEIPDDYFLSTLCPLLGGYWVALLLHFKEELKNLKAEIENRETSKAQKALMILNGLKESTQSVPVSKLKNFIETIKLYN